MSFYLTNRLCLKFTVFATLATAVLLLIYAKNVEKISIKILRPEKMQHIEGTASNTIHCFREDMESLPDISEISPRPGKSIFFLETSCRSFERRKITITSRQACAVESAAKMNPDLDIYLLFSSPGVIKFEGDESDKFLEILLGYRNVKIMHLNVKKYTKGTPVERLYSSGTLEQSIFVVSHTSDVLRFLTLYKYGGIYLDLDVIVKKSLQDLPLNFAGIESNTTIGSAVLSFAPHGIGHTLAKSCLDLLETSFNGTIWGNNGPDVITRILTENCDVEEPWQMLNKKCEGVKLYSKTMFYPISYGYWPAYFMDTLLETVVSITKDSYAIHIWNKLSVDKKIPLKTNAPYLYFANQYCSKIVNVCKGFF